MSRSQGLWLVALLGIGLRVTQYVTNPAVWHDEAAVLVNVLEKSPGELFGPLRYDEAAPPGFLLLEWAVAQLLNESTWALRLLPLAASIGAVVLLTRLIDRHIVSTPAALASVGLFVGSESLLWHTVEAKPYVIDVLIALLLMEFFQHTSTRSLRQRSLLALPLAVAMQWVSFPGSFLAGGLVLALGWSGRSSRRWQDWLAWLALGMTIVVSFAVLYLGPIRAQRCEAMDSCWTQYFPADVPWRHWPAWFGNAVINILGYCFRPVGGLLLAPAVVGIVRWSRQRRFDWLLLLLAPIAVAAAAAVVNAYPFGGARVLVYSLPAWTLLIGLGLDSWMQHPRWGKWSMRIGVAVAAIVVVQGVQFTIRDRTQRARIDLVARVVLQERTTDEWVASNCWEMDYYGRRLPEVVPWATMLERPVAGGGWFALTGKPVAELERLQMQIAERFRITSTHAFRHALALRVVPRDDDWAVADQRRD